MTTFYKVTVALVRPIFYLLFPYKVIGIEKADTNKGFILASNHLSYADPFFLILALRGRTVHFMAKSELFKNKLLGGFIKRMGAFPVERGKGDMGSLKYAEDLIKNDKIMGIFPEGTRSKTGEMGRAKSGVALIAAATKSDVLPVHIIPKTKDKRTKLFHKTYIVFGDMISFEELGIETKSPSEFKTASRLIVEKISELKA